MALKAVGDGRPRLTLKYTNATNYKSKWRNIWIRDVFCYWIPLPWVPVPAVPTKTRFEFRFWNKKCKPHFLYTIGVHFRYRIKNKIDSEVESRAKKYRAAEEKRVNNGRSRYWCESQDPPVRFNPGKYTCNADSSYTLREQVCGGSVFILATSLLCAYLTVILSCVFCCFQLN